MTSSTNPILFVLSFLEYEYFVFLIGQEFANGLKHRFHRRKQAEGNIDDVYDGKLYKDQFQHGGFLSQQFNMSFKVAVLNLQNVVCGHSFCQLMNFHHI